jgi:hypothetical protein
MHKPTFPRAAGVSPPWVCDTSDTPEERHTVRRLPHARTRPAHVTPPCLWITHLQSRSSPTVGSRRPLLVPQRTFNASCTICDAQTHVSRSGGRQPAVSLGNASATGDGFIVIGGRDCQQERRASARRACVIQAIRQRYGTLFGDYRTHEQDRHTSARRAYEYRTCNRERFRGMSGVAPSAILKPANLPAVSDRE